MTSGDTGLNHLAGIKKPFLAPLHLSYPLDSVRRLSSDEATQICERDSTIKPTTRETWELSPIYVQGVLHAALSKMSKRGGWHAEATWHLPVAPGHGLLRLSSPLGSGRALSDEESRQLRSIGGVFARANPAWSVTPSRTNELVVDIVREPRNVMILVGTVVLAAQTKPLPSPRIRSSRVALTPRSLVWLSTVF